MSFSDTNFACLGMTENQDSGTYYIDAIHLDWKMYEQAKQTILMQFI